MDTLNWILLMSIVAALVWVVRGKLESKFATSQLWLALSTERERCVSAAVGEFLSGETDTPEDVAYNHAIRDCIEAIRELPIN